MRAQLRQRGQFGQQLALQYAIGQRLPQQARVAGHVGAALGRGQVALLAGRLHQKGAQRQRSVHQGCKCLGAVRAHKAVGVVLGRQKQKLDAARVGGVRQRVVQRLARCAPAGAVAVKAEHHRVGEAQQFAQVLGRARRAQRGHRVRKTQLRQRHHVHVALGDQRQAALADGGACLKQAVQLAPLVEQRGFGRIEVFGFVVAQHAPAKADAFALHIADREHHAVAKTVVAAHILGVVVIGDDQAGVQQQRVVVLRKHAGQPVPAGRCITQPVAPGQFAGHAAPLEVLHRAGGVAQLLAVGLSGLFQHIGQRGLLLAARCGAFALLRRQVVLRHLQAGALRQVVDRLDKTHAGVLHQKPDGIAVFSTAKTVKKLFGRADAEGRRFFAVERAQPHEIGTAFFQLHIAADQLDDVGAVNQLLDKRLGNGHRRIFAHAARRACATLASRDSAARQPPLL